MKIAKKVLTLIDTNGTRNRLAVALGKSESSIKRYIDSNSDDLTKAAAIEVIMHVTNLSREEILEYSHEDRILQIHN